MDNKKQELQLRNGGVSPEQIETWKREHGKIVEISVIDGDTDYRGYFCRPSMKTMSAVNTLAKTDEVKSSETMFDSCWLGGDLVMKTDAIVKMASIGQLATIFNSCVASIKNL